MNRNRESIQNRNQKAPPYQTDLYKIQPKQISGEKLPAVERERHSLGAEIFPELIIERIDTRKRMEGQEVGTNTTQIANGDQR